MVELLLLCSRTGLSIERKELSQPTTDIFTCSYLFVSIHRGSLWGENAHFRIKREETTTCGSGPDWKVCSRADDDEALPTIDICGCLGIGNIAYFPVIA